MKYEKKTVDLIPSEKILENFELLISSDSTKENDLQEFIYENPEILFPLEFNEFVRHLRYPKRNILNPSVSLDSNSTRIPDFDGVRLAPFSTPIVIEMKQHKAEILDYSSGGLSKVSLEVINQVQTAVIHMLREEGRSIRDSIFGIPMKDAIGEDLIEEFEKYDAPSNFNRSNSIVVKIMTKLLERDCGLIALIGLGSEFKKNQSYLVTARKLYLENGVLLLTYDELLQINEVIRDYCTRNEALFSYFGERKWSQLSQKTLINTNSGFLLTEKLIEEIQEKIYRLKDDVCFFGFGPPVGPTKTGEKEWAVWEVSDFFNIGMLWAKPTHLKGEERLLWAGRLEGRWLVVKERLTEPLLGGIAWYLFAPPVDRRPIV